MKNARDNNGKRYKKRREAMKEKAAAWAGFWWFLAALLGAVSVDTSPLVAVRDGGISGGRMLDVWMLDAADGALEMVGTSGLKQTGRRSPLHRWLAVVIAMTAGKKLNNLQRLCPQVNVELQSRLERSLAMQTRW